MHRRQKAARKAAKKLKKAQLKAEGQGAKLATATSSAKANSLSSLPPSPPPSAPEAPSPRAPLAIPAALPAAHIPPPTSQKSSRADSDADEVAAISQRLVTQYASGCFESFGALADSRSGLILRRCTFMSSTRQLRSVTPAESSSCATAPSGPYSDFSQACVDQAPATFVKALKCGRGWSYLNGYHSCEATDVIAKARLTTKPGPLERPLAVASTILRAGSRAAGSLCLASPWITEVLCACFVQFWQATEAAIDESLPGALPLEQRPCAIEESPNADSSPPTEAIPSVERLDLLQALPEFGSLDEIVTRRLLDGCGFALENPAELMSRPSTTDRRLALQHVFVDGSLRALREQLSRDILHDVHSPNPELTSAKDTPVHLSTLESAVATHNFTSDVKRGLEKLEKVSIRSVEAASQMQSHFPI